MTTTVNTEHALNIAGISSAIASRANIKATFKALACLRDYVTQTDETLSAEVENLWVEVNKLKNRPGVTQEEIATAILNYFSTHPNVINLPCMSDDDDNQYSFVSYLNTLASVPQTTGWDITPSSDADNPLPAGITLHTTKGDLVLNQQTVTEGADANGVNMQTARYEGTYRGFAMPVSMVYEVRSEIISSGDPLCGKFLAPIGESYPVLDFSTEISPCPNAPEVVPVDPTTPTDPVEPVEPTEPEIPVEPEAPTEPDANQP